MREVGSGSKVQRLLECIQALGFGGKFNDIMSGHNPAMSAHATGARCSVNGRNGNGLRAVQCPGRQRGQPSRWPTPHLGKPGQAKPRRGSSTTVCHRCMDSFVATITPRRSTTALFCVAVGPRALAAASFHTRTRGKRHCSPKHSAHREPGVVAVMANEAPEPTA